MTEQERLKHPHLRTPLWKYLSLVHGVSIRYSDSGWQYTYRGKTYTYGDVEVGLTAVRMGLRNNPVLLMKSASNMLESIRGLLDAQIFEDPMLREKMAEMRVVIRRGINQTSSS